MDEILDVSVETTIQTLLAKTEARVNHKVEWFLDNDKVLSLHKSMFIVQAIGTLTEKRGS